jgi:xanthine dehydrogenase iron-sulfur cluster and FAD-binding subunit A
MWHTYHAPAGLDEALGLLARYGESCRIIAGGTDLILELERGVRTQRVIVDISRIPGLATVRLDGGTLSLGPLATHNQVAGSAEAAERAFPLARACWQVGAPQIRNRGTVAGNIITASPANDTITPLWAMDATVTLVSQARGKRMLTCGEFFKGVRRTALAPDELLARIDVPVLGPNERGTFLKLGLRQAQAISLVNVAVVVDFAGPAGAPPGPDIPVARARIALGAVAPTILRATEAEAYLAGRKLDEETIAHAAELAAAATRPISDIRAGADYRRDMARVLTARALRQLRDGGERADWPGRPVMLWGHTDGHFSPTQSSLSFNGHDAAPICFNLNGKPVELAGVRGKTLLRALREDAGLTGTKEGCAEGECGACTVWLDGIAVMSCLVPAERAEGCSVVTVEGLAGLAGDGRELHPVQEAFVDAAAVQCGYCTPGFLMSAASLLDELPQPSAGQIKEALTGNLCRCTGYYKIVEALERAAVKIGE